MVETPPRIVVLTGLPGSGKSTWAAGQPGTALSSDEIRRLLTDDVTNQQVHRRVFRILRQLLAQRLELRRPVTYIDATNLTPWERRPYIELAQLHDARAEAVGKAFRTQGIEPLASGPAEYAAHIVGETAKWTDVVAKAGLAK